MLHIVTHDGEQGVNTAARPKPRLSNVRKATAIAYIQKSVSESPLADMLQTTIRGTDVMYLIMSITQLLVACSLFLALHYGIHCKPLKCADAFCKWQGCQNRKSHRDKFRTARLSVLAE